MHQSSMKIERSKVRKKWQLFHARDFQSLMCPCFSICYVFGAFPYKNVQSTFVSPKARIAYSTIVTGIYTIYLFVVIYQIDFSGVLEYDSVPGMLQGNCYLFLGGIISLLTYILSRPRMRVLQGVLDVSSRLPPETFNKLSKWIHAKDILGFLFLFLHLPNAVNVNIYQTLSKMLLIYITLIVFIMDMLYMNCVCVLKACFESINESLMNLKEILVSDEPHLLRRVYHEQKNPLLLIELRALKKRHLLISDVVQVLNTTFSLQIVATVILTFAEVTFSLYFYILQRIGEKEINLEKQIWYSYFITSVAYYWTKLNLIVWACETGKDQALQIGTNIHEVLISTSDKQIKDELELFSLQVLHRDNIFSAKGLIVDATLLTKIVGGITTYLLILIQFLNNETACNKKNAQPS